MNLLDKEKEMHLSRALRRVGSMLVCISFALALAFPPQPVKAVVVADDAAIAAVAAAFLSSCGMTFSASGMDTNGVKEQIGAVLDGYLNEMFDGQSPLQWMGEFTLGYGRGKIVLPAGVANKLSALAEWVREKFGVKAGNSIVVYNQSSGFDIPLENGKYIRFGICYSVDGSYSNYSVSSLGSNLMDLPDGISNCTCGVVITKDRDSILIRKDNTLTERIQIPSGVDEIYIMKFVIQYENQFYIHFFSNGSCVKTEERTAKVFSYMMSGLSECNSSFELGASDLISVPDTIPDTQEVAISTGAASDLTLDQALEQILAAIAAGQLSATKEITEAGTATGEQTVPVEETFPDVEGLGLPALAETLTTRFPFSIPWDVAKAVKLLAAPPKTPRFEVDFMAPIAYRFGGQLGNTMIVLDFSDYEIIGQISRWTSTIGFCLLLASGTKKLIWTA